MIDHAEAKRFIDAIPWPEGMRPLLRLSSVPGAGEWPMARGLVHLYRPEARFATLVEVSGCTTERALKAALEGWVTEYKLPPELNSHFTRLVN